MRPLGRHDAGNARRAQNVALLGVAREDGQQRLGLHDNLAFGDRGACRLGLAADIHHVGLAVGPEMGEVSHLILGPHDGRRALQKRLGGGGHVRLPHQAFADQEGADA